MPHDTDVNPVPPDSATKLPPADSIPFDLPDFTGGKFDDPADHFPGGAVSFDLPAGADHPDNTMAASYTDADPEPTPGNLEPLAPVQPASGWLEDPDGERAGATAEAEAGAGPKADGSDLIELPPQSTEPSDVILATAFPPGAWPTGLTPPPARTPPPVELPTRESDVALSFDQPPSGSTIHERGGSERLPVAEELPDPADDLFAAEDPGQPIDSGILASTPGLPADPASLWTEFSGPGSAPPLTEDTSSILSEVLPEAASPPPDDGSDIRLDALDPGQTLADAPPPAAPPKYLPVRTPTTDVIPTDSRLRPRAPNGDSDLFATAHTAADIDIDIGKPEAFPRLPGDEGSFSARSSIFSESKPASGGSSDVRLTPRKPARPADDEGVVEFNPNADPSDESELTDRMQDPDSAMIDWGTESSPKSGSASGILSRRGADEPTELTDVGDVLAAASAAKIAAVPKKDTSDPSVVMDWVADSSEKPPLDPSRPHARPAAAAVGDTSTTYPAGGGRGWLGGGLVGLAAGVAACAGLYFGGVIGNREPAGQQPTGLTRAAGETPGVPPPVIPGGAAAALAALEGGDPAAAIKALEAAEATTETRAALGQARMFARVRELVTTTGPVPANDPAIRQARADLEAAATDPDAAKTPAGARAAVRAALHLGLTYELTGERAKARATYETAMKTFPASAAVFQAALDRLAATTDSAYTSSRLTPAEVERLATAAAFALVFLQDPAAAGDDAPEAGLDFWRAVNAAAANRFAEAVKALDAAKAAHVRRARALAGRGLNPLSDPLEQIFPRCCDDLKAYWQLKDRLYASPVVKAEGVEAALASLGKQAEATMKLAADLKTATDKLVSAETELKTEKAAVTKLEKDLTAAKEGVLTLEKKVTAAQDELKQAVTARAGAEAVVAGIAKELQAAKLLPEKYDAAAILAAQKEAIGRATGPNLAALIPSGVAAVGGTGLATGHLLDLANRITRSEASAKAAADKLLAETKRLQDQFAAESQKLRDAHAAELKAATAGATADLDKLKKAQADELKKLADKYAAEIKVVTDARDAAVKKAADVAAEKAAAVEAAVAQERLKVEAMAKKFQAELGTAVSPSQTLDVWLPLLAGLRRPADADPALEAARKVLASAPADSEEAAKATAVAGLASWVKGDPVAARELFARAKASPAFKAAAGTEWARAVEAGLAPVDHPFAAVVQPATGPKTDLLAAARALNAGILAYKGGRYFDAERSLAEAVASDPGSAVAWYFLGAARWQVGNRDAARADFRQGAERERARAASARAINELISPIQGPARDALAAIRP